MKWNIDNRRLVGSKTKEISLEANPSDILDKSLDFKCAGISRLSLGVQSFNDRESQLYAVSFQKKNILNVFQYRFFLNKPIDSLRLPNFVMDHLLRTPEHLTPNTKSVYHPF